MLNTFLGLAVVVLVTLGRPANSVVWPTTPAARAFAFETVVAGSMITADIKSEHLTGTLPNGAPVVVRLKAQAHGLDASSLTGEGRHFASTGAHNYWSATGFTDGTKITLSGNVTDSNAAVLIGSPVEVVADASTDEITLTFGPLAGGPFAGQTLVFTGAGKVTITQGTDRTAAPGIRAPSAS